jgi:hypothetical protein
VLPHAVIAQLLHTFSNLDAFLSVARTRASSDRCFRPLVGAALVCYHEPGTDVNILQLFLYKSLL